MSHHYSGPNFAFPRGDARPDYTDLFAFPNTALGPTGSTGPHLLGLWARTLRWVDGRWVQAERGARASQTPFLTGEQNAAYRAA